MTTTLETHAVRTRCHDCGSTDIEATCHHCGKPLCEDDLQPTTDSTGKPLSKEFAGLELEKAGRPQHCSDCHHVVQDDLRKYLYLGGAVAVLGLLLLGVSVTVGFLLLLAGAGTGGVAYYLGRRRAEEEVRTRQPMPVVPTVDSVRFVENLRGTFTLGDDGGYQTSVTPVTGELEISMTMSKQDRDRVDLYRRKYRLAQDEPISFSAGFAVLAGPAALQILGERERTTLVPLGGKVADHPFFGDTESRSAAQWQVRLQHELRDAPDVDFIPVWLTPTLVPSSDRRALELDVQWTDLDEDEREVVFERIESLKIAVPIAWGNVQNAVGRPSVGLGTDEQGEPVRTIEWTRISVADEKARAKRRIHLQVQFERQIELSDAIAGHIEVTFAGAVSGVKSVHVHYPLGGRRGDIGEEEVKTVVRADFRLSLAGVRYQDLRLVPDRKKKSDEARVGKEIFEGVVPNHHTVIELTNAMADDGYYVKCAVEGPPGMSGGVAAINRDWEIAGRRYDGVYPVDFRVLLTGVEHFRGHGGNAASGTTNAEITVQGAYASAAMEARIEREWEQLRALIVDTLRRRGREPGPAASAPPPAPPPGTRRTVARGPRPNAGTS